MKVLVLGSDGYIGWPLSLHLKALGHEVIGLDDFSRRARVKSLDSDSLTPIMPAIARSNIICTHDIHLGYEYFEIWDLLHGFNPDAIVHLAEQPSAPWSMRSVTKAITTQSENVLGTLDILWAMKKHCLDAHLIKLGTMGEYGTPNCEIPEGRIPMDCLGGIGEYAERCPMAGLLFPRTAGSFYHLSKVMDTLNIEFACRNWGLTSTDIMQGPVIGLNEVVDPSMYTRFDYDECFGTVVNRFCAQAIINHPLTVYGRGGQTRGYLPLKDSIQCITLAIENPPLPGTYRTLNQFAQLFSVNRLAEMVVLAMSELGLPEPKIDHIPNPRKELEQHFYQPDHQNLFDLGYKPTLDIQAEITKLVSQILPFKDRVKPRVIMPTTMWR